MVAARSCETETYYVRNKGSCFFNARSEKAGENSRLTRAWSSYVAVNMLRTPIILRQCYVEDNGIEWYH